MNKIIILFLSLFIIQSSFGASFKELQKIPHDSTNAEKMKIWFPVKNVSCKVHLRIFDSKMNQVRELLYKKVPYGYYNIYWDKKDDSGNYVPEGTYKIATISCEYKRLEPIVVKYTDGENVVQIFSGDDIHNPSLNLTLLKDSLQMSLEIVNKRLIHIDSIFSDSLMIGKTVSYKWVADSITPNGSYYYKLKVNDFEHFIPFKYKK